MRIHEGSSLAHDPVQAVAEATAGWGQVDMILAFSSPVRSAAGVAAALAARFPGARIAGCTTAGEHLTGAHTNGALVVTGIASPKLRWATTELTGLATVEGAAISARVADMFVRLGVDPQACDTRRLFCLLFVDGLSGQEERIAPLVAEALDGVRMVGGSAGDDLQFRRTEVIHGGEAKHDAAVLVLCECGPGIDVSVFKHQHYVATQHLLAITRADPAARRVYEIDGLPAAQAYARALGIPRAELDAAVAFTHPLAFEYQHELFIRSVQKIYDDDSIGFYCALEEGMVVDVSDRADMVGALAAQVDAAPPADLVIGANCILRALEADRSQVHPALGAQLCRLGRHVIGFDTYGEQLDGLHINQTLVAVALRDAEAA
jgi:hypothetical protein